MTFHLSLDIRVLILKFYDSVGLDYLHIINDFTCILHYTECTFEFLILGETDNLWEFFCDPMGADICELRKDVRVETCGIKLLCWFIDGLGLGT